ncbi:cysteine dioxygenase family protein [Pseudonocardia sp. KRD291]|uniref:cysteine dioxygenase n=1 Tax=Pseudonocardia sp. KRD291 TaxID=2792007 RepID=UPI001C49CF4A|nr:cysteine dioxygenase family protein [Pseudonocardia sp. KRD291]MBW0104129.1 cysteine dioxygenase family protein [Pseudonocardia sp. KRD291]
MSAPVRASRPAASAARSTSRRGTVRPLRSTAPTPHDLDDLRELTREIAAEVRAGQHEVVIDPERRWYRLLRSDGLLDVWLISWATEQIAELHDHAGSLGAMTVVSGALTERRWTATGGLRTRTLRAERGAGFPLGHVHDVANPAREPAVSVHAYSPPLSAMSYYDVENVPGGAGQQRLRRLRTELVEAGQGVG